MKKIFTSLSLITLISFGLQAQFSMEWVGPDLIQEDVDSDVEFDFDLTNGTSSVLEMRWRLTVNDFPSDKWDDYVCDVVCYDSSMRARDLDINGDTVFPIILHVAMDRVEGFGKSTLCFWERSDSAGTIQCITARSTTCWDYVTDTMEIEVSGAQYYVVEGQVYEMDGGSLSMVTASGVIDYQSCNLLTIGENIYAFEYSEFEQFDDYDMYSKDGEDIYVIDGKSYVYDGNKYVFQSDVTEDEIDGVDVIIIGSDTFELFGNTLVPLNVTDVANSSVSVFPNPANDFIILNGLNDANAQVSFIDVSGRVILNRSTTRMVDTSELPAGHYTVLVSNDEIISTQKIVILK